MRASTQEIPEVESSQNALLPAVIGVSSASADAAVPDAHETQVHATAAAHLCTADLISQHMVMHKIAQHRLHALGREMPFSHRVANLQYDVTMMRMSKYVQDMKRSRQNNTAGADANINADVTPLEIAGSEVQPLRLGDGAFSPRPLSPRPLSPRPLSPRPALSSAHATSSRGMATGAHATTQGTAHVGGFSQEGVTAAQVFFEEDLESGQMHNANVTTNSDGCLSRTDAVDLYAFDNFILTLHAETDPTDAPQDVDAPVCHCGHLSSVRCLKEDPNETMWVCASENCAFFDFCVTTGIVVPASDAIAGGQGELKPLVVDVSGFAGVADFWQKLHDLMRTLDDEVLEFLTGKGTLLRHCDCGVPATIAVCRVTGDIFWTCSLKSCFCLQFCDALLDLAKMDVGQIVKFGESGLDRHTSLGYVMRWFGRSFDYGFFKSLSERPPDASFPQGSVQAEVGQEYDTFISYRGATGRASLWLALCGHYNLFPAFIFMYAMCPTLVGFMNFVNDPCGSIGDDGQMSDNGEVPASWRWLTYGNTCWIDGQQRMWFVFRAYVAPLVILTVIFWHPVMSRFYDAKIFLDKFC